ncbi:MAG TPA: M23 family metallopeptidase [Bacillota bacterium]|nr:M23 family metallopeptidase [Bacillota bacterium]
MTIPSLALHVGLPIAIGLAVLLVGSYVHMTHGMVQLSRDRQSKGVAIEELLRENELLKEEKDERIAQLKELTEKADKLAAAVDKVVGENSKIWDIVKGPGAAKSTSSSSSSAVRGATSRGGDPGADRGEPVIGSSSSAWLGPEEEIRSSPAQDEDELAVAASEALARLSELTNSTQKDMYSLRSSATQYRNKLNHTPSIAPTKGKITSGYGNRLHPILRVRRLHEGVDIAAPRGTPIVATADGVVARAGWLGSYGNVVEISHGYGITTFYAHNSRNAVKVGATVKRGQVIAYVGSTGLSTGAHVHYEVRVNKRPVDPSSYMK